MAVHVRAVMRLYLERYWRDVHHTLITYTRDQIQPRLPGQLRARVEERVFVESEAGGRRILYPDVHVIEYPQPRTQASAAESGVAVAEPSLVLHIKHEPTTQGYVEIIDAGSGNRVVTVVEFVSPSNKESGEGQDLYKKKQEEVRAAGANLVEIDLPQGKQCSMIVSCVASAYPLPSHAGQCRVCAP